MQIRAKLGYLFYFLFYMNGSSQVPIGYFFSHEIIAQSKEDTLDYNLQNHAVNFTNIGDYQHSLFFRESFEKRSWGNNDSESEPFAIPEEFASSNAKSAIKEIVLRAREYQVLMINEAHHSAQNRVFSSALLEGLYDVGYRHLLVEDLNNNAETKDKDLNSRKYPLTTSGYFIIEPQYGNFIREALRQGYIVDAYEHFGNPEEKDLIKKWQERESGQASNITEYLLKHPNEKVIVHCGEGHHNEGLLGDDIGMMGALFKKKTGIDPLTINQTAWLESFSEGHESPFRKAIIDRWNPNESSIIVSQNGTPFSHDPENIDITVFHPDTKYIAGRTDWINMSGEFLRVPAPVAKFNLSIPFLLFAYIKEEFNSKAIPVDLLEIKDLDQKVDLLLKADQYILLGKDVNGKEQEIEITVLK